ncbi:MAG: hypothetical protein WCD86_05815, partial [Ktedonobacteraceae bacterium]
MMQTPKLPSAGEPSSSPSFAARVIPRGVTLRQLAALETTMATLALDARHAVALEVVGDERGVALLMRASDADGFAHLARQVQALYPQAEIVPLARADDPLRRDRGEAVTVVELTASAAPYLSLRTPDERAWNRRDAVGDDPLLGVLGAVQGLPEGVRAIAQLALVAGHPRWSR